MDHAATTHHFELLFPSAGTLNIAVVLFIISTDFAARKKLLGERKSGRRSVGQTVVLTPQHSEFSSAWFGTNPSSSGFEFMAKTKTSRAVIPEPSFSFFLRTIVVKLLLVVLMTAYFSLHS
jgi:hypothetical protein